MYYYVQENAMQTTRVEAGGVGRWSRKGAELFMYNKVPFLILAAFLGLTSEALQKSSCALMVLGLFVYFLGVTLAHGAAQRIGGVRNALFLVKRNYQTAAITAVTFAGLPVVLVGVGLYVTGQAPLSFLWDATGTQITGGFGYQSVWGMLGKASSYSTIAALSSGILTIRSLGLHYPVMISRQLSWSKAATLSDEGERNNKENLLYTHLAGLVCCGFVFVFAPIFGSLLMVFASCVSYAACAEICGGESECQVWKPGQITGKLLSEKRSE